jgi:hypothetical protein
VLHFAEYRELATWLSGGPSSRFTPLPIDLQRSLKHVEDLRLGVTVKRDYNSGRQRAFEEADLISGLIRCD